MAEIKSGVYPVNKNKFALNELPVAQMETFEITVETGVETWNPMELEGWQDALATSKSIAFKLSGKRCIGDAGNDFAAGMLLAVGQDAYASFDWIRPTGETLHLDRAVITVEGAGGDSTGVEPLVINVQGACKPTVTPATA